MKYLNPESSRLKKLQEDIVAAMAQPQDNPWYARLTAKYLGKIMYDQKAYYRVFAIQYVPNKGKNLFPCWEATTEPVYKNDAGDFVVHARHLVAASDGSTKLLKAAEVTYPTPNSSACYTYTLALHPKPNPYIRSVSP